MCKPSNIKPLVTIWHLNKETVRFRLSVGPVRGTVRFPDPTLIPDKNSNSSKKVTTVRNKEFLFGIIVSLFRCVGQNLARAQLPLPKNSNIGPKIYEGEIGNSKIEAQFLSSLSFEANVILGFRVLLIMKFTFQVGIQPNNSFSDAVVVGQMGNHDSEL